MAKELRPIDVTNRLDLLRVAEEVHATQQSRVLRRNGEDLAILTPVRAARRESRMRVLSREDPLWELVGSAVDAAPTDASRKHAYLAEAPRPTHP